MTASTVNLVVNVPETLRRQARVTTAQRGETISDVVRQALADYIELASTEESDAEYARQIWPASKQALRPTTMPRCGTSWIGSRRQTSGPRLPVALFIRGVVLHNTTNGSDGGSTAYWLYANSDAARTVDRSTASALAKHVIDGKSTWDDALAKLKAMAEGTATTKSLHVMDSSDPLDALFQ